MDYFDYKIKKTILSHLLSIEGDRGVKILYAAEGGSRAWNIHRPDSDYDVRFIYVQPLNKYLRLNSCVSKDVIEVSPDTRKIDIEIHGWDLRKALNLLIKSNCTAIEWIRSPVVYLREGRTVGVMKEFAYKYFNPKSIGYHYHNLAKANFKKYIEGKPETRASRYIHVIRSLTAATWMLDRNTLPPLDFEKLIDVSKVPPPAIIDLFDKSKNYGKVYTNNHINKPIMNEIERQKSILKDHDPAERADIDEGIESLNQLFREQVQWSE